MQDVVSYALQTEQLGTGHAVKCASDFIGTEGDVVVLCGDTPLVTGKTLEQAIKKHVATENGVTVISAMLSDPFGYGRIIRDEKGLSKIVEQKDATEEEQAVKEVNSGMYIFKCDALLAALSQITMIMHRVNIICRIPLRLSRKWDFRLMRQPWRMPTRSKVSIHWNNLQKQKR